MILMKTDDVKKSQILSATKVQENYALEEKFNDV